MALPGWGTLVGKIASWVPNPKQAKENEIDRLMTENARLAHEEPLSAKSAHRIQFNLDRIKQLRKELERID